MMDFDSYLENAGTNPENEEENSYMQAYSLTAEAKAEGTVAFVDTLLQNEVKTIVFAHHFSMLDAIEAYAVKKNVGYVRIDGKVNATARHEAVTTFQERSEVLLAILSLTACGTGLTLTASSTVVFAELSWTPGVMKQAEDRVHRIGQQSVSPFEPDPAGAREHLLPVWARHT